jgi:hypothetical protein
MLTWERVSKFFHNKIAELRFAPLNLSFSSSEEGFQILGLSDLPSLVMGFFFFFFFFCVLVSLSSLTVFRKVTPLFDVCQSSFRYSRTETVGR